MKFTILLLVLAITASIKADERRQTLDRCMASGKATADEMLSLIDEISLNDLMYSLVESQTVPRIIMESIKICKPILKDASVKEYHHQHSNENQKACIQNIVDIMRVDEEKLMYLWMSSAYPLSSKLASLQPILNAA